MNGLVFEAQPPPVASDPNRLDIACFVGFVGRQSAQPLPHELQTLLSQQGWDRSSDYSLDDLYDVPVPIESWSLFDLLFAWDQRPVVGKETFMASYLGAAVRSFFAQGGRKCYVVRMGDPWCWGDLAEFRNEQIGKLIPGYPASCEGSPLDPQTWSGLTHLFGLTDVTYVCLPDLPDAVAVDPTPIDSQPPMYTIPEQFADCAPPETIRTDHSQVLLDAPRCDDAGYRKWANAVQLVAEAIARHWREVQLVASIPLPWPDSATGRDMSAFLDPQVADPSSSLSDEPPPPLIASAFVQLAYPWVRTAGSCNLPGRLEAPEGVLAGLLAQNALARGAFRSAAGLRATEVYEVYPTLAGDQIQVQAPHAGQLPSRRALVERVSVFGPTPGGMKLLSDVTTSSQESYRPAGVNRLMASLLRAARRLGEGTVFEPSEETLWSRVASQLNDLLYALWEAGALRGSSAEEAFAVRCDRGTMTQNDIDNGRVIARVEFSASASIEQIVVMLALDDKGQVSLAPSPTTNSTMHE